MLKVLKGFVYLMALVGFAAVGYLVYLGVMQAKTNLLPGRGPVAAAPGAVPEQPVAGTAQAPAAAPAPTPDPKIANDPALASIVQSYQKDIAPQPAAGAAGTTGAASASIAAAIANKPVRTPGPDNTVITKWPTGRKWVALTFDDGPHPEHTPKLLDLLNSKGVKATFFVLGPMVQKSPEIAQAIVQSGHEIANHTMTHPQLRNAPVEKVREEIGGANQVIKEITGADASLIRPPYGMYPKNVQSVAKELNMNIVNWSVDTEDWKSAGEDRMKKLIMDGLNDGAIILMHDTKGEKVYNVTASVIDEIRAKGYEFVTVSQLLGRQAPTATAAAPAAAPAGAAPAPAAGTGAAAPAAAPAPAPATAPGSAAVAAPPPVTVAAAPAPATGGADAEVAGLPSPQAPAVPPVQRKQPAVSADKLTTVGN